MTAPNKQPDVLDDLLCGSGTLGEKEKREIELLSQLVDPALIGIAGGRGRGRECSGPVGADGAGEVPALSKKVTYYLSPEVSARLAEIQTRLQQLLSGKLKRRLSKSRIVEHALRMLLAEFESREKESLLAKWLQELPE